MDPSEIAASIAATGIAFPWVFVSGPGGTAFRIGYVFPEGWYCVVALGLGVMIGRWHTPRVSGWFYLGAAAVAGYKLISVATITPVAESYLNLQVSPGVGAYVSLAAAGIAAALAFRGSPSSRS
jgi:hypothetical protein